MADDRIEMVIGDLANLAGVATKAEIIWLDRHLKPVETWALKEAEHVVGYSRNGQFLVIADETESEERTVQLVARDGKVRWLVRSEMLHFWAADDGTAVVGWGDPGRPWTRGSVRFFDRRGEIIETARATPFSLHVVVLPGGQKVILNTGRTTLSAFDWHGQRLWRRIGAADCQELKVHEGDGVSALCAWFGKDRPLHWLLLFSQAGEEMGRLQLPWSEGSPQDHFHGPRWDYDHSSGRFIVCNPNVSLHALPGPELVRRHSIEGLLTPLPLSEGIRHVLDVALLCGGRAFAVEAYVAGKPTEHVVAVINEEGELIAWASIPRSPFGGSGLAWRRAERAPQLLVRAADSVRCYRVPVTLLKEE